MRIPILFIFLSISFISCKKEKMVHITATNVATGERMPGLHYYVVELKTGTFGDKPKTVAEGDLDANGEANFALKIKNETHVIRVVQPENNCYAENLNITFGSKDDYIADFKFAPCGYVKINYNNVNCEGPEDIMNFRRKNNYVDYDGWSSDRFGCYSYFSPIYGELACGQIIHEVRVVRSGVTSYVYDTTFLGAGEYKIIDLNY